MPARAVPPTVTGARVLSRRRAALAVLVALLVAGAVLTVTGLPHRPPAAAAATVTVLTRNLYLGGDITRPVRAAQGRTGPDALLALGQAAAALRTVVDETDFPARARLLAAEIADREPDLVGLQEVALWRHGPLQLDHPGRVDATSVDLDFLALLRDQLAARGAAYAVAATQDESDVEAPAFAGDPFADDTLGQDVRLTMRDVVLVRIGADVEVTGTGAGQYDHRLTVDLGGVPFSFVRGYAWVDARVGGRAVRFVTTQLESQRPEVTLAQAQELVAGPLAVTGRPVVLGCDCNSDPVAATSGSGASAAYALLTASGLADAWVSPPDRHGPGLTCCLGERLDSPAAALRRRIDLVLSRGGATSVQVEVVGVAPADRDPASGQWSSDHAGVLAELRLG